MERKIGEIFEFAGRKLRVEKAKHGSCDGCYFLERKCLEKVDGCYFLERKCLEKVHGECCDDYREDNTDVIFKDITDEESK